MTRTISLAPGGAGPIGVTVFRGFVWVANHDGEPTTSVSKIDPATMRVVDVIPVGADDFAGPEWILSGAGSIWTNVNSLPNVVVRIDPRTDRILATIPAPSACAQLAADRHRRVGRRRRRRVLPARRQPHRPAHQQGHRDVRRGRSG